MYQRRKQDFFLVEMPNLLFLGKDKGKEEKAVQGIEFLELLPLRKVFVSPEHMGKCRNFLELVWRYLGLTKIRFEPEPIAENQHRRFYI
jgi:hypothetical protein